MWETDSSASQTCKLLQKFGFRRSCQGSLDYTPIRNTKARMGFLPHSLR